MERLTNIQGHKPSLETYRLMVSETIECLFYQKNMLNSDMEI